MKKNIHIFEENERPDLVHLLAAGNRVAEAMKVTIEHDPEIFEVEHRAAEYWDKNHKEILLMENPFVNTAKPYPIHHRGDIETLKKLTGKLPESLMTMPCVVKEAEGKYTACVPKKGKIWQYTTCGKYGFATVGQADDFLHGIYDKSTVELYHACRYREEELFCASETNKNHKKYANFQLQRFKDGHENYIENDLAFMEFPFKITAVKKAVVIQNHSPLGVFIKDYGKRIAEIARENRTKRQVNK